MQSCRKWTGFKAPRKNLASKVVPKQAQPAPKPVFKQSRYATRKAAKTVDNLQISSNVSTDNILAIPGSEHHNLRYDLPFRFLDLPPELRNRVYGYIFNPEPEPSGLGVIKATYWATKNLLNDAIVPIKANNGMLAILGVCRQIYDEARDLPLANSYISFSSTEHVAVFLGNASYHYISAIKHVEIPLDFRMSSNAHYCGMLRLLPNMASLRLVDSGLYSRNFLDALADPIGKRIRGLRGLKEFEIVLDESVWEPDADEELDDEAVKEKAEAAAATKALTALWKPLVTQSKPASN